MTGIWIAAAILAGYVALLVALGVVVRPIRYRIVDIGSDLLDDTSWTESERAEIENLIETCFSFAVGLLIPIAAVSLFLDIVLRREFRCPAVLERLQQNPRYHDMLHAYGLSICAANPLAVAVAIPIVVIGAIIDVAISAIPVRMALSQPMVMAAHRMAKA